MIDTLADLLISLTNRLTGQETDRQTGKWRDKQMGGETDRHRQIDRGTDMQNDRQNKDYCLDISFLFLISRSLALKVFIISWRKKKENWLGFLIKLTSPTTLNSSLDLFNLRKPDQAHLRTKKQNHNRYKSCHL